MTLRQLEVFHAIMKAGSVTGAARNLHVSQPAISAVLKHTEQQLKMKLFERITGRLQATPEAMALLPDVNDIFGRIDTLKRMTQEMYDGRSGRVVIATSPTLVNAFLPRALGLFRQKNPSVFVSIVSLPTPLAIDRVARREADLGLVYAPVLDSGVDSEELATTEIACVIDKSHPLAKKREITAADLAGESVISLGATTTLGMLIEAYSRKAGVAPPVVSIEASSSLMACLLVGEGAGVALVDSAAFAAGALKDLVLRAFRPHIPVPIRLIFPRERPRSRATRQLTALLRTVSEQARIQVQ